MKRNLLLIALLLVWSTGMGVGQPPSGEAPPLSLNSYVPAHMIMVPPVAGIPFSATVVVESKRTLPDGSVERMGTINLIGRDVRGRTRGEERAIVPQPFREEPNLVQIVIYDPGTSQRTTYDVGTHTARQQAARAPKGGPDQANPQISVDDLGFATILGMDARGTRRTFNIAAERSGTGTPLEIVDDYWYCEELHLNLLVRHSDPRIGVKTFTVTRLKREEPPVSFFEPAGYRIAETAGGPQ